jgi:predicted RNase H-like nuclease
LGARRNLVKFKSADEANSYYWKHEGRGFGISRQLWSLKCKIKEVDDIVTPGSQRVIRETHPELVFWTRNRRKALGKKKTDAGREERIRILSNLGFTETKRWLALRFGTGIGRDDLIDACACAIAARDATISIGDSKRDVKGLRMEINF